MIYIDGDMNELTQRPGFYIFRDFLRIILKNYI